MPNCPACRAPNCRRWAKADFKPGDRVRYSGYALQGARDWWLSQGHEPQKSRAKDAFDKKNALRGTVLSHGPNKIGALCTEVKWDDGCISKGLDYMVIPAEDA